MNAYLGPQKGADMTAEKGDQRPWQWHLKTKEH